MFERIGFSCFSHVFLALRTEAPRAKKININNECMLSADLFGSHNINTTVVYGNLFSISFVEAKCKQNFRQV